jgi:hypothetical protein
MVKAALRDGSGGQFCVLTPRVQALWSLELDMEHHGGRRMAGGYSGTFGGSMSPMSL